MFKYEQKEDERIFINTFAAFQDRITLLHSCLSSNEKSDYEKALEVAVECRDLVRLDGNLKLGVFAEGNHKDVIDNINLLLKKNEIATN